MNRILICIALILASITLTACGEKSETPDVPVSEVPADVPFPDTERHVTPNTDTTSPTDQLQTGASVTTEDPTNDAADTTAEIERPQNRATGRMRPEVMAYRPEFRSIIGDDNRPSVMGKNTSEVDAILGEPRALVRQTAANPEFSREVRIYLPYDEDPTGFYIYFRGGEVVDERLDEFNGLYGSTVLEWFKM
ncbi:MAG: lipoprotein [Cyclonatronaceae bacterium]